MRKSLISVWEAKKKAKKFLRLACKSIYKCCHRGQVNGKAAKLYLECANIAQDLDLNTRVLSCVVCALSFLTSQSVIVKFDYHVDMFQDIEKVLNFSHKKFFHIIGKEEQEEILLEMSLSNTAYRPVLYALLYKVGRIYQQNHATREANKCFEKCLAVMEAIPDVNFTDTMRLYRFLDNRFTKMERHKNVLKIRRGTLHVFCSRPKDIRCLEVVETLHGIANTLSLLKRRDQSLNFILLALRICLEIDEKKALIPILKTLKKNLKKSGKKVQFRAYLEEAMRKIQQTKNASMIKNIRKNREQDQHLLFIDLPEIAIYETLRALFILNSAQYASKLEHAFTWLHKVDKKSIVNMTRVDELLALEKEPTKEHRKSSTGWRNFF